MTLLSASCLENTALNSWSWRGATSPALQGEEGAAPPEHYVKERDWISPGIAIKGIHQDQR